MPKYPWLPFSNACPDHVARFVLREKRSSTDRGIHNRAFLEQQAFRSQVIVDGIKHNLCKTVRLRQTTKLWQRGGVKRAVDIQIDDNEMPNCLAVVDHIFHAFIRQTKALLDDVHAQHAH